jgi:cytochrome b561
MLAAGAYPVIGRFTPAALRRAARLSHAGLFGLMIAMPLLGWGMLSAGGSR